MRESMYLESKDKLFKDLNEKKAQLKRFEAETEEIRKEYESVMEQKIQKESEVALYQKQIQDLEREHEEIEIRVNAVREGRMRVLERSSVPDSERTAKCSNHRTGSSDRRIKTQINDQQKKKTLLVRRSKRSMRRKNDLRSNVIMPRESKKH